MTTRQFLIDQPLILINIQFFLSGKKVEKLAGRTLFDIRNLVEGVYPVFAAPGNEFWIFPTERSAMARFGNMVFVNFALSAQDEKAFTDWLAKSKLNLGDLLEELAGQGFKLSATFVGDQAAYCFTLVGTDATKQHKDKCMSSWADNLAEAVAIGYYKHVVLCDSGAWPESASGSRWG